MTIMFYMKPSAFFGVYPDSPDYDAIKKKKKIRRRKRRKREEEFIAKWLLEND